MNKRFVWTQMVTGYGLLVQVMDRSKLSITLENNKYGAAGDNILINLYRSKLLLKFRNLP